MKFDDILTRYVGDFGRYQKIQIILVCVPTLFLSMHSISWTFTGASVKQRCNLPGEKDSDPFYPENPEYVQWMKMPDDHTSECQRPVNVTATGNQSEPIDFSNLESCPYDYKWDESEIKTTALKRWSFVCKDVWLKPFVHSFYYIGQFFGSFLFGILADRFGRKPVFFVAIFIQVTCGVTMSFVPYWPLFTFLRFMLGFAHPAVFVTAVVVAVEMVGPSKRFLSTVVTTIFFATGQITLAGLAYIFRHYEQLQLAISAPVLIFVVYWWLVPESARWLVTRGKLDKADKILRKIARFNNRTLPDNWSSQLTSDATQSNKKTNPDDDRNPLAGLMDMFRTRYIRKHTLVLFVCWPIVSMAYYGLAMNPSFMGGDRYLSMVLSGSLEILVAIVLFLTINQLGRKFHGVAWFIFAGVCLIASVFIPPEYANVRMLCVALGKMAMAGVYGVLYVFTPELFPTVIRMTAVGSCSMIARFGSMFASYVFLWMAKYYPKLVAAGLGVTCILAASLMFLLPDTNGQPQVETVEEAENFAKKKQKTFLFAWDLKRMEEEEQKSNIKLQDIKKC